MNPSSADSLADSMSTLSLAVPATEHPQREWRKLGTCNTSEIPAKWFYIKPQEFEEDSFIISREENDKFEALWAKHSESRKFYHQGEKASAGLNDNVIAFVRFIMWITHAKDLDANLDFDPTETHFRVTATLVDSTPDVSMG
jgi:hypothetical protein